MTRPFAAATAGLFAGAAGATALNLVTYVDQAVRARPAGDSPGQTVNALSEETGVPVPGSPDERQNRLEGLGPLSGLGVGLGVGAVAGLLRGLTVTVPKPVAATVIGLGAMAISDTTMTVLKVTDPRSWSAETIVSDVVPHLAYGVTVVAALHLMLDPRTPQVH
jgi:ribose/xylose/arabinose/galactoside ABC-type transport system permease subunit